VDPVPDPLILRKFGSAGNRLVHDIFIYFKVNYLFSSI
jgi:hypothetical protein